MPRAFLRRLFLTGLLLAALPALAQNRVLFIGNSFTIGSGGGGVPGIFDRLAQAGGHAPPAVVMRAVNGESFFFHSQDATSQATLRSQPWTHVVLQNYSTEPTHLAAGSLGNHFTYGALLYRQALSNSPLTQVVLFETWSRSAAHPLITGVSSPSSFASTAEFQAELRTNYHQLASLLNSAYPTNRPVVVAPVGTAWENAGGLRAASDPLFLPLHGSDEYHGNNNGYYLAACVIYSRIYGVSPRGLYAHPLVSGLGLGLTVSPTILEDFAWATVSGSTQTGVQTFLLDFGADATPTTLGPAPNDPAQHWNNVTEAIGASPTGQLPGLVTTTGLATDIGLVMLNRFNSANENGTTTAAAWPANATRDSLFGNTEPFGGAGDIYPRFKLTRLNPARTYTLTFHASRMGVADNRETRYSASGLTTATATLNAANNTDGTVMIPGLEPDAAGEITLSLAPGPNNDSANHFTYLGVLRVDAVPWQEPIVFTQHPASQTVPATTAAMFNAAFQGTPPYFVQWLTNGVPLPGATALPLVIPSVTPDLNGVNFSVIVSNLAFSATSSNALLTVTAAPTNTEGSALWFDFGGTATTGNGPAPDDPANFWNNLTTAVGSSASGRLTNLVTVLNQPTTVSLVMLSRFNGANENGTLLSPLVPANATRDSLYGNTESFNGLVNIFPSFKLVGLNPEATYNFTFYASRTGVSDNRETGYTVTGANTGFATLNVANNVTNVARVNGIAPNAAREITLSLAPTPNNNNANHFTYLGALRVLPVLPPRLLPPRLSQGQLELRWTGDARLYHAPALHGPWTPLPDTLTSPHLEPVASGETRLFRVAPR